MERLHRRTIKQILRINHAGTAIAIGIFTGQSLFGRSSPFLNEKIAQERDHRRVLRELMWPRGTSPSLLLPLFGLVALLLGLCTALGGADFVMACDAAVERGQHALLQDQLAWLRSDDETFSDAISALRTDTAKSDAARSGFVANSVVALIWCATYGAPSRLKRNLKSI